MSLFKWHPFYKIAAEGEVARQRKNRSKEILSQAQRLLDKSEEVYQAQRSVSDQLREEQRKNHFAELFAYSVPIRNHKKEGD